MLHSMIQTGWGPRRILTEIFAILGGLLREILRGFRVPIAIFVGGFIAGFAGALIYGAGIQSALLFGLVSGGVCVVAMCVIWVLAHSSSSFW